MNFLISFREFWRQKSQLSLYILSLVFSLGVFVALDSVQVNVTNYINAEKQNLVGGDIKISSNRAFEEPVNIKILDLKKNYEVADVYEFSSMARTEEKAVLSQIKVVSSNFPLYGAVELNSGKKLSEQLKAGQIVVESNLLSRLDLKIGESLQLGDAVLKIVDTIVSEPDRSLNLFGFGPRVLVSMADAEKLNLIGDKSRVSYTTLVKVPGIEAQKNILESIAPNIEKPAKIESLDEIETTLSRFSNRFLIFLKLVIFSLLILTGIGIMTILQAFLQSQRTIIATRKSLGETNRNVLISYLKTFSFWSAIGLIGSVLAAHGMLLVGQSVLQPILPTNIELQISFISIAKSLFLGFGTTLLFAIFALRLLRQVVCMATLLVIHRYPPGWIFVHVDSPCFEHDCLPGLDTFQGHYPGQSHGLPGGGSSDTFWSQHA